MKNFIVLKNDCPDETGIYHFDNIKSIICDDMNNAIYINLIRGGKSLYYDTEAEKIDAFNGFLESFRPKCHIVNESF